MFSATTCNTLKSTSLHTKAIVLYSLVLFALILPFGTQAETPQEKLIGAWGGIDTRGVEGGFVFQKDGGMQMIVSGEIVNADESLMEVTWSLDSSKKPMHLDMNYLDARTRELVEGVPSIVRFMASDKIQVRIPQQSGVRPAAFTAQDDDYQVTLTRK